jgi:hypothetical protein
VDFQKTNSRDGKESAVPSSWLSSRCGSGSLGQAPVATIRKNR